MVANAGLQHGPLGTSCTHLCVDMQRMYAEATEWQTPWMRRVLPNVSRIVAAHAPATIFTRFIPASRPGEGEGTWRRYYQRWASMTMERLEPGMIDLLPDLAAFLPPAEVIDKQVYSPWLDSALERSLQRRGSDTLIISGGETDVCVLATVLGGVDRGYRIVIVADALCSSSDQTHDSLMTLYANRYGQQIELVSTAMLLSAWTG